MLFFKKRILIPFLLFVVSNLLFAGNKPVEKPNQKVIVDKSKTIPIPEEASYSGRLPHSETNLKSVFGSSAVAPGVVVGNTWYDYQHNGSLGRMIGTGPHSGETGSSIVHFSWMKLLDTEFNQRHYAYNFYNSSTGILDTGRVVHPLTDYGGYVNLDVTPDNQALVGGHVRLGDSTNLAAHFYLDAFPFSFLAAVQSRIPDSVASYDRCCGSAQWPKLVYQYGTDTVLHVIAAVYYDPNSTGLLYFRHVGSNLNGSWDYPPYQVINSSFSFWDSYNNLSHTITASRNSDKVAISWLDNLNYTGNGTEQYDPGVCDTCVGVSPIHVQRDNDLYYQISHDQGATWEPRVNLTKNRLGEVGFRPYNDISILIDSNDDVNLVYPAAYWPADPASEGWGYNCDLFHWSEATNEVRTVTRADFQPTLCTPGAYSLNISKVSISECNGKLFALFTQYNDGNNGVFDDCSASDNQPNGELWLSVSSDNGISWDRQRNLTNSYTPGCDPEFGAPCESDDWASMTRYGRVVQGGEDWSGAVVVDPSGTYIDDYYLDVQYIHDPDAGGIVQNEGTWQIADVNWFRLACVDPIPFATSQLTFSEIAYPAWTNPGVQLDTPLTIINIGNTDLNYTISIEEDNGPSGWLSFSGFSGTVPYGLTSSETGSIILNNTGVEMTEGELNGRLIIISNSETSPDTIPVQLFVVDTLQMPVYDTIYSGCLALTVSNYGSMGNMGIGNVNMDWNFNGTECDSLNNVYLFDGSPFIGWIDGFDTVMNWSVYNTNYLHPNGFVPIGGHDKGSGVNFNWYRTGTFVTHDSSIALEKIYYAPTDPDSCDFMLQRLLIWSNDGQQHDGLRIGEIVDWDIPSDTATRNDGFFNVDLHYFYQTGLTYGDDTNCIDNENRHGAIGYKGTYLNPNNDYSQSLYELLYSGYISSSEDYVHPTGNLIASELWQITSNSGYTTVAAYEDLHTILTTAPPAITIGITDTLELWTVLATVLEETGNPQTILDSIFESAYAWNPQPLNPFCCNGIRGNIDSDPGDNIDIADLVYLVSYSFSGGDDPTCFYEADVDNTGAIDIADIVYLVAYMFAGGPDPLVCD